MKQNGKKIVEQYLTCDTDRLYGSLSEAIKYLQEVYKEHPEATLYENWTGYEDMSMVFSFSRLETDEEYALRIEREEMVRKNREKEKAREEQRKKDLAELTRLKRKLGVY